MSNNIEISLENPVEKLDAIDTKILQYKKQGLKQRDIAKLLNLEENTISRRVHKKEFKDAEAYIKKTAIEILIDHEVFLMNNMLKHTRSEDERISLQATSKLIDKTLPDKIENKNTIIDERIRDLLDEDDLNNIIDETKE